MSIVLPTHSCAVGLYFYPSGQWVSDLRDILLLDLRRRRGLHDGFYWLAQADPWDDEGEDRFQEILFWRLRDWDIVGTRRSRNRRLLQALDLPTNIFD